MNTAMKVWAMVIVTAVVVFGAVIALRATARHPSAHGCQSYICGG